MTGPFLRILRLLLFCITLLISQPLFADPVDSFIDDDIDIEDILSDIPYIDIAIASRDDIAAIPMFDSLSADALTALRDSLGTGDAFLGALEHQPGISSFQREIIRSILLQEHARPQQRLLGYVRSGYIHKPENEAPHDGKYYTSMHTSTGDNLRAGIVIERDPFETNAIDLLSFYGAVTLDKGRITIVLGDFRSGYGQNLVFSRYSRTYTAGISAMAREPQRIVNTGFEEANYLRGAHITLDRGPVTLRAFGSSRPLDATLDDTGSAVTILDSGIHAPGSVRGNLDERLVGGRISYASEAGLLFGVAGVAADYSPPLGRKDGERYLDNPSGSNFTNMSVDAAYTRNSATLFFEHARNPDGERATAGGIQLKERGIGASLMGREYTPGYWAPRPAGMSSFGATKNEKGVYGAIEADLPGDVSALLTMDLARLLTRNYSHDMPVSRRRVGCVFSGPVRKGLTWKFITRGVDDSDSSEQRWNTRFHILDSGLKKRRWSFDSCVAWSESGGTGGPYMEWRIHAERYGLTGNISGAVFDIPDYESRFYRYEYNVPGRGMSRPVWGQGGSVICTIRRGPISVRYRYADSDLMEKASEVCLQTDMVF